MKRLLLLWPLVALAGCKANPETAAHSASPSTVPFSKAVFETDTLAGYGTKIHYVIVNSKNYHLEVADQPNGPGTVWSDVKTAAIANDAIACINAGFFTPEGKPLGICIDHSKRTGSLNTSSLGSGAFVVDASGKNSIIRRSDIKNHKNPKFLLQAGPFLIENKKPIKLKESDARPRSFIARDSKGSWMLAMVESISLPDLVKALQKHDFSQFKIETALNLDGGRSSQLYFFNEDSKTSKSVTAFMHRKVRNFLVIKAK